MFSPSKASKTKSEVHRSLYRDLAVVKQMVPGCRRGVLVLTSISVCR